MPERRHYPEPRKGSSQGIIASALAAWSLTLSANAELSFEGMLNPGEEPTVFAVFADFGFVHGVPGPAYVASMIKSWRPDFLVVPGDLNYGRTAFGHSDWDNRISTRYGDFIKGRSDNKYPLQASPIQRFFPVIGNHDTTVAGQANGGLGGGDVRAYVDYFVRNAPGSPDRLPTGSGVHGDEVTYYDFYWGDMHFVMADSDRGRVDAAFAEAQNAWISNTLQTSTGKWKFVVFHHPAWSSDAVHGSQAWMQGAHLSMADAVFAGHAHLYERLEVDGTPFFTSGLGGSSFYPFQAIPLPESQFRHNTSFGALRVTKNNTGVLCEFLSIADGANGGTGGAVIDSHALGAYEPVCNIGRHPIDVVAGQTIDIETSLPAPPGGGANGLDPRLEIFAPDGALVTADDDGAGDGINASLTFVAADSGRYTIAVTPEITTSGPYGVSVEATPSSPTDAYTMWAAQHFGFGAAAGLTAPEADPDMDSRSNFYEFSFGTDPQRAVSDSSGKIPHPQLIDNLTYFDLPLSMGLREDVHYEIEASPSLDAASWITISSHTATAGWSGSAPVVVSPGEGASVVLRVCEPRLQAFNQGRYYRLKVSD